MERLPRALCVDRFLTLGTAPKNSVAIPARVIVQWLRRPSPVSSLGKAACLRLHVGVKDFTHLGEDSVPVGIAVRAYLDSKSFDFIL